MKKREIPVWPETLQVVLQHWGRYEPLHFCLVQPGEKPKLLPDVLVLGMATYCLQKPENKKRRKR